MSDHSMCTVFMIFMLVWGYGFGYLMGKESAEKRLPPVSEQQKENQNDD